MKIYLPANGPGHLGPAIELAVRKAGRDFPGQRQLKERIGAALFAIAEILCKATENGEMRVQDAHESLESFLHQLCVRDPDSPFHGVDIDGINRFVEPYDPYGEFQGPDIDAINRSLESLKDEIRQSKEWGDCLERLARLALPKPESPPNERRDTVASATPLAPLEKAARFQHDETYRWVSIRGEEFFLTPRQAEIIKLLHEAYKNGKPEVLTAKLLEEIGAATSRLRDVFRSRPGSFEALVARPRRGYVRLNL